MRKGFVKKLWGYPVETQVTALREFGIPDKDIYVDERADENVEALLRSLRTGRDEVYIAADLRVFGSGRKEILGITDRLEGMHIAITDLAHPEDKTLSKKLGRATAEISKYARFRGSKKEAKRTGQRGGKAKGEQAMAKRAEIAAEDVIRRLCAHPKLTWQDREDILGISSATLRRRYAPPAQKRKR